MLIIHLSKYIQTIDVLCVGTVMYKVNIQIMPNTCGKTMKHAGVCIFGV